MRNLLIDADVVAFSCAAACEQAVEWEPGYWTWNVSFEEVKLAVLNTIDRYMDALEGDGYTLCLTDHKHNFRLDILPTYKGNRKGGKRPLVLKAVKQWMIEELDGVVRPGLEGDDIIGIMATKGKNHSVEQIVVSIDKDLKTIPCTYVRDISQPAVVITEQEADYNHLMQALTGDTTDGYSGCPGIGPKRASEIVQIGSTIADNWQRIVQAYASKGLGEEEALRQARVARILRSSDYDFTKKEPILWTPK
jgi:DNA polymerase-1